VLRAPELDAGVQVGSHQRGAEGQNPLSRPAGHACSQIIHLFMIISNRNTPYVTHKTPMLKAASFAFPKRAKDDWTDVCTQFLYQPQADCTSFSLQSRIPGSCGKYKDEEIDQHIESM